MHILRDYRSCPEALKGAALAIGNFDGVHKGHQAVLRTALDAARASGKPPGVMTFEPHPRAFFQPDVPLFRLTPEPLKLRLLEALGLDLAVVLAFDATLASLTAEQFVQDILVDGLGISHVLTGHDFHFGKGRAGNPELMRDLGAAHGFEVSVIAPQESDGGVYSSTGVRACLRDGDAQGAADRLGYWWRITGTVVGGDKRGHGLGFPTANVAVPNGFDLKHGIYAVRVQTGEGRYNGAAYLGTRPSFDDGDPVIETFLFDFSGDLYGKEIEIELIDYLRGDEKFDSAEALKTQMKADCDKAQAVLTALENQDPMRGTALGAALG